MCLIVHKPAGRSIPPDLIEAAAELNPDGWGAMGFDTDGRVLIRRDLRVDTKAILAFEREHRDIEYVLHLRRRTRGTVSRLNSHPFKVTEGIYLVHNGTLNVRTPVSGWSDTRHFVTDLLRPLARRYPQLLADDAFHKLLALGLRSENKLAVLDARSKRIIIINREHGAEFEGLWLSSTRWIDQRRLHLAHAPQPQERSYRVQDLGLLA